MRDEHDRRRAAVRRGAQCDRDAVPVRQPADDEHAQAQVVGEGHHVELRGLGQLGVEGLVVLLGHAEAAVLDLDGQPLGHHRGPHDDRRGRGRVEGGVLDQLGQQMDHVGHRGRREVHLLLGVHLHPLVLGDLADRAAQDVDQRHRLAPAAAGPLTADDDQVLLVAAQLAGRGVQFVQPLEDLGVLVHALQRVELGELEVDQVLALPGDAQDDLLEAAPGVGEFDGGVHGRTLGGVERLGDLAQFVVAVVQRRGRQLHVDLLAPLQPGHHVGQPFLGQAQGGLAQAVQPTGQGAGDPPGHPHAQQQGDQTARAQGRGLDQQAARLVGAVLQQRRRLLPDQHRVRLRDLDQRGPPLLLQFRDHDVPGVTGRRPCREHPVLDGLQGAPVRAAQDPLGLRLRAPRERGQDLVLDEPAMRVHRLRELGPGLLVHPALGPRQGQQRVLLGHQLRRVLQGDERTCLRGQVAVVDLGELLERVDLVVDDRRVLAEGLHGRDVGGPVHLAPVVLQAAHRRDDRVQPVLDPARRLLDLVRPAEELRDRLVGLAALRLQRVAGHLLTGGEPYGREAALPLQRERGLRAHGARRPAQPGLIAQPQPLREHLDRRHAPDSGEHDAGHEREEDQGETYGAEAAPGTCPWRHRRPRAISGGGADGGRAPGVAACPVPHRGCAGC